MTAKRPDGRKPEELREMELEVGVIKNAKGSARFRMGKTIAIAAVYGPRELYPKFLQNPERGIIRVFYDMFSFSVPDRKRPGPNRRSIEIDLVLKKALESVVMLEEYPNSVIDIFVSIMQANAGTRCAALTAASVALADAGIPMKDLMPAVTAGKIGDTVIADLTKEEEDWEEGATDIPVAYSPVLDKVTLLQLDGKITKEELKKAVDFAVAGCMKIYELQKKVLKDKYNES